MPALVPRYKSYQHNIACAKLYCKILDVTGSDKYI